MSRTARPYSCLFSVYRTRAALLVLPISSQPNQLGRVGSCSPRSHHLSYRKGVAALISGSLEAVVVVTVILGSTLGLLCDLTLSLAHVAYELLHLLTHGLLNAASLLLLALRLGLLGTADLALAQRNTLLVVLAEHVR
mmetsp:Transcript_26808/g.35851  ORF Transcript_26808/g.35851 Transcript_26808/m.35851 type:complete len:138 (-) Transcript_26808:1776-2189(-)